MTCHDRDQDILLLTHGELPMLRRIVTQRHLQRCPRCQEKQEQLTRVSHQIARTLRDRAMAPWSLAGAPSAAVTARMVGRWRLATAAVLLLVIVALAAVILTGTFRTGRAAPGSTVPGGGCLPGLPNDHCRG